MRKGTNVVLVLFAVLAMTSASSSAAVHTGTGTNVGDLTEVFTWGDGTNDLTAGWTINNSATPSVWIYGDRTNWGFLGINVDVHNAGPINPLTVSDASVFAYTAASSPLMGNEIGDAIFLRGTNGYYGVWVITAIDVTNRLIDLTWYFQDDGSADFTMGPVAVEATSWGRIKSLY